MKARLLNFLVLIIGGLIIFNLATNIVRLWSKRGIIDKERQYLEVLKNRHAELKLQLKYVKSEEFLEKEARDKLGLGKPGEEVWVLPEVIGGVKNSEDIEDVKGNEGVIWRKWLELFGF